MTYIKSIFYPTGNIEDLFYSRANRLKMGAYGFLAFIVILLGAGVYIFVNAADFTRADLGPGVDQSLDDNKKQIDQLDSEIVAENKKAGDVLNGEDQRFRRLIVTYQSGLGRSNCTPLPNAALQLWTGSTDPTIDQMKKAFTAKLDAMNLHDTSPHGFYVFMFSGENGPYCLTSKELSDFVKSLKQEDFPNMELYKRYTDELANLSEKKAFAQKVHDGLYVRKVNMQVYGSNSDQQQTAGVVSQNGIIVSLAQTTITRFGTLAIISFLVAILVPLYRYNMRLAAFYLARGDAFRLKSDGIYDFDLAKTVEVLTPAYDFGKTPPTPSEQIIDLFKAMQKIPGKD